MWQVGDGNPSHTPALHTGTILIVDWIFEYKLAFNMFILTNATAIQQLTPKSKAKGGFKELCN